MRRRVSRAPVLAGFLVLGLVVGALLARNGVTQGLDSREALRDEGARLRGQLQVERPALSGCCARVIYVCPLSL